MRKKLIVLCFLLIILLAALHGWQTNRDSFQKVTVTKPKPGFSIALYKASDAHESNTYEKSQLVFKTSGSGTYKVKKGEYVYVVSGKAGYQTLAQPITVDTN